MNPHQQLYENEFYHIYNRGNNGENLFYNAENYFYFLRKFDSYLSDYLDTFAYCLLSNHFHLLARIKPYKMFPKEIASEKSVTRLSRFSKPGKSNPTKSIANEFRVSEQFRKFFMGYAKAINKQESRTGILFQKNFKRKPVTNQQYFSQLIYYIHANAELHGICTDFCEYPYSSYERILSDKPSKLFKHDVLGWFGGKEEYISFHKNLNDFKSDEEFIIED